MPSVSRSTSRWPAGRTAPSRASLRHSSGQRHLGWWAAAGVATSLALHLTLWRFADELGLPDYFRPIATRDVSDRVPLDLRRARINEEAATTPDQLPPPVNTPLADREIPEPTPEPVDLTQFKHLKFEELTMSPAVELPSNIVQSRPLAAGDSESPLHSLLEAAPSPSLSPSSLTQQIQQAAAQLPNDPVISQDQVMLPLRDEALIDEGALEASIEAASRAGQGGASDADGLATLDDLLNYEGPLTEDRTAMMPTDLLFEYNSAELKDSARLSLMKLGYLIQSNPDADISIEGHCDTFGSDEYNQRLSETRAEAVKAWLVESLRFDPERLNTRGWGKRRPLVPGGTIEEQAKNRRVEIVIRPKQAGRDDKEE